MKLRNKILISVLIFCFGLIFSETVFGTETIEVIKGESVAIPATRIYSKADNITKCTIIEGSDKISKNIRDTADPDYLEVEGKKVGEAKIKIYAKVKDGDGTKYEKDFIIKVVEEKDAKTETIRLRVGEKKKIFASDISESSIDLKSDFTKTGSAVSVEIKNVTGTDYAIITGESAGTSNVTLTIEFKNGGGTQTNKKFIFEVVELEGSDPREESTFVDILDNIEGYAKPGDLDAATSKKIENAASIVLSAITSIGVVAAIVILAVLGLKYMLGSVEEKAEYKKDLIPYLVGAGLLFGVSTFVKIFMQWGQTIANL